MNIRRFFTAASVGVLGFLSVIPTDTVDAATCTAEAFTIFPSDYGIDICAGNNLNELLVILATMDESCSLTDLLAITDDTQVANIITLIENIVTNPDQLSTLLYSYMTTTTATSMTALCSTLNTIISPCAKALIPQILPIIQADTTCCSQLSDLLDLLNLVVPATTSMDSFLLNELVNGVNGFLCSNIGTTTCGTNIFSQLTTKYTASTFKLLSSVIIPFTTITSGQECTAMTGGSYTNSASLTSASTINYGCCIHKMRPLIQSIQNGFSYLLGSSVTEVLNGVVDFSNNGTFVDSVPGTASCTFSTTCTDPSFVISGISTTATPGTNNPGKNTISNTSCTMVSKCDAAGTTCSQVCQKGTASVSTWLNQTLAYQRKLAYNVPLCYAQIPATHNSAITLADGYGNRDQLFNLNLNSAKSYSYLKTNNHVLSLTDQLQLGVRFLEVDTHYFLDDFYTAHCGNLGSNSIETLFDAMNDELSVYGSVLWGADLLGCFPSVSGIKPAEQVKTHASMQEIKNWLDDNQDEFVFIYLDTGDDLTRLSKLTDLNTLLTNVFGDLIVPQSILASLASGSWKSGSIQTFINAGYRVMLLANSNTGLAYSLYSYCGGHQVLSTDYIASTPSSSRVLGGLTIYGNSYLIRSYQAELRYISLSEDGEITETIPTFLTSSNIANYTRWNLNLVAPDMVDGAKMNAQVWSWAENEPSTTASGASVYINTSGRWVASTTLAKTWKACWSQSALTWSIVAYSASCASGYTFTGPVDPYQNYLLKNQIASQSITIPVVINATLA